jgi:hypothetical protein
VRDADAFGFIAGAWLRPPGISLLGSADTFSAVDSPLVRKGDGNENEIENEVAAQSAKIGCADSLDVNDADNKYSGTKKRQSKVTFGSCCQPEFPRSAADSDRRSKRREGPCDVAMERISNILSMPSAPVRQFHREEAQRPSLPSSVSAILSIRGFVQIAVTAACRSTNIDSASDIRILSNV